METMSFDVFCQSSCSNDIMNVQYLLQQQSSYPFFLDSTMMQLTRVSNIDCL